MSKAASSPTARLLQSSRLFSLPRPLPPPSLENITFTSASRASETATLPYPTHQAITTPASSHHRGDWGLKRALPSKATRGTSTPHIRISAQDTPEHITDFGSAADHTQSEAKWREMGVPMMIKPPKTSKDNKAWKSVFEDDIDNTDDGTVVKRGVLERGTQARTKQRWKYTGPWIAGMQDGEFENYVQRLGERRKKDVKGRSIQGGRERWREFLRQHVGEQRFADARRSATAEGATETLAEREQLRQSLIPTDEELPAIEKRLRDDHAQDALSSELTALICAFLDLPAVFAPEAEIQDLASSVNSPLLQNIVRGLSAEDSAPPSTHPSAGLSYLRTNAIMDNHPIHGPQAHRSPVLARVVRPRMSVMGTEHKAKLGLGGFVAEDSATGFFNPNSTRLGSRLPNAQRDFGDYDPEKMTSTLDADMPGGNKIWSLPISASVDSRGRVKLLVSRADKEAVAVKTGDVQHIHEAKASSGRGTMMPSAGFGALPQQEPAISANYGAGLPDLSRRKYSPPSSRGTAGNGPRRPRSGVTGFDEELGLAAESREAQSSQIRELLASRTRREQR